MTIYKSDDTIDTSFEQAKARRYTLTDNAGRERMLEDAVRRGDHAFLRYISGSVSREQMMNAEFRAKHRELGR